MFVSGLRTQSFQVLRADSPSSVVKCVSFKVQYPNEDIDFPCLDHLSHEYLHRRCGRSNNRCPEKPSKDIVNAIAGFLALRFTSSSSATISMAYSDDPSPAGGRSYLEIYSLTEFYDNLQTYDDIVKPVSTFLVLPPLLSILQRLYNQYT